MHDLAGTVYVIVLRLANESVGKVPIGTLPLVSQASSCLQSGPMGFESILCLAACAFTLDQGAVNDAGVCNDGLPVEPLLTLCPPI